MSTAQVDHVADRLTDELVAGHWLGVKVLPSPALPVRPSLGEWCRRYTRHQWGPEVLGWLGQDVGPHPDAETHLLYAPLGSGAALDPTLFVSPAVYEQIVGVLGVTEEYGLPRT